MALRRYRGGSQAPPGIYLESWLAHPSYLRWGEGPLPGPPARSYFRLSPLWATLLAPLLGTLFVFGFLLLTPLALLAIPFLALGRRLGGGGASRLALMLVGAASLLGAPYVFAQGLSNEACLGCHRNPGLTLRLGDGTRVPLQVSPEAFARSAHGRTLLCTACHREIDRIPHPPRAFADRRALTLEYSRACTTCHAGKYKEFQESVHWKLLAAGDRRAPLCADCHGAHTVPKGGIERGQVSQACAQCHGAVHRDYEKSVHGKALIGEGNPDVPTCSSCHRSHTIQDPRTVTFRIDIPKLCADCHQDRARMAKYGISPEVVSTYLEDFHGVSVGLFRRQATPPARLTAVCTDCHGIHDIRSAKDPQGAVVRANILRTCQKCHPGAPPNFPTAWLSHHIPSPRQAALVYYVRLFYLLFIPGVVGVLSLHVAFDLVHEVRALRARRKKK